MPQTIKLALLDDYQKVAMRMADWDRLKKRGVEITVFHEPFASVEDAAKKLAPFQVLGLLRERTAFSRALIEKLTNLKFMVLTGARASSLDDKAASERGIPISNTPGGGSNASTAELCWALLMSCARDLAKGGAKLVTKDELLKTSDFVTIHLVLSERTRGLLGAADLAKMKKSAILINTSRGPIVDEAALIAALKNGTIAHAGLDVYDKEPLPKGHPLTQLENVTLVPHLGYVVEDSYRHFYAGTIEDIEAWLDGKPINVINSEALKKPV